MTSPEAASAPANAKKLRVCLLVDSLSQPGWVRKAIETIEADGEAEIGQIVVNAARSGRSGIGRFKNGLFLLYYRLEEIVVPDPHGIFAKGDVAEILPSAATFTVEPVRTKFSDSFGEADLERIRAYAPDVIIRLGFRILRGEILNVARYGVWSLHHGDNRVNRGRPAGFWEVMLDEPVTGVTLQRLDDTLDGGSVLERVITPTHKTYVKQNRLQLYAAGIPLFSRALKKLSMLGPERFFGTLPDRALAPAFYSGPQYTIPGNAKMAGLVIRHVWRAVRRRVGNTLVAKPVWCLFYSSRRAIDPVLYRYRKLTPPAGSFWADPFAVEHDGRNWIFFEDFSYARNRAVISAVEIDARGEAGSARVVLERPYHLSYPFMFKHEGSWYMIPETRENKTVELYRCVEFPGRWELHSTLLSDVQIVDPTVIRHKGHWYLFGNRVDNPPASSANELYLYDCTDILTDKLKPTFPWPVTSDCRVARPAGGFFEWEGALIRPSQINSITYGYGINLSRVVELSRSEYREELLSTILPDWRDDIVATHTLSSAGSLTVLDGLVRGGRDS